MMAKGRSLSPISSSSDEEIPVNSHMLSPSPLPKRHIDDLTQSEVAPTLFAQVSSDVSSLNKLHVELANWCRSEISSLRSQVAKQFALIRNQIENAPLKRCQYCAHIAHDDKYKSLEREVRRIGTQVSDILRESNLNRTFHSRDSTREDDRNTIVQHLSNEIRNLRRKLEDSELGYSRKFEYVENSTSTLQSATERLLEESHNLLLRHKSELQNKDEYSGLVQNSLENTRLFTQEKIDKLNEALMASNNNLKRRMDALAGGLDALERRVNVRFSADSK